MRAAKVQASLRIRAVSPEPPLLAHTSIESRGTFRQKARSLAPLNGWACAVKICHDGMLEDTNSLDGAHILEWLNCCFNLKHKFLHLLLTSFHFQQNIWTQIARLSHQWFSACSSSLKHYCLTSLLNHPTSLTVTAWNEPPRDKTNKVSVRPAKNLNLRWAHNNNVGFIMRRLRSLAALFWMAVIQEKLKAIWRSIDRRLYT